VSRFHLPSVQARPEANGPVRLPLRLRDDGGQEAAVLRGGETVTAEQVARHCEELTRRVQRGLKVQYPQRSVFRWKNRMKAWYDLTTATFFVQWSSRFAVLPKAVVEGEDLVTAVPYKTFGGYTDEEHIPELIAWINADALKAGPVPEGQMKPFIVTYGSD
jgi:hypothetical protein